ncbi:hypothetical protein [Amycolatopsis suaedae]|uniref:hypothetical protein n=1 Tax=Amycolatopsis suaedae TaxID=2510978 RepID=UPI001F0E8973|nr:hypothetical protein [Amycolatopsis suaedae]
MHCYGPSYPPYTYRAIAHCVWGNAFWSVAGNWARMGFRSSSAECSGGLLSPALVAGYDVDVI